MYTCGFRINANLVKEGSFRINAKLVKEELKKSKRHIYFVLHVFNEKCGTSGIKAVYNYKKYDYVIT